jgi:hypothetical protein
MVISRPPGLGLQERRGHHCLIARSRILVEANGLALFRVGTFRLDTGEIHRLPRNPQNRNPWRGCVSSGGPASPAAWGSERRPSRTIENPWKIEDGQFRLATIVFD